MRFDPPLTEATLLRRYKRFFADIEFDDGTRDTAHTNNTGRMTGCSTPGARVLVSRAPAGNKLAWRWHAVKLGSVWQCVDTQLPNKLVVEALRAREIPELARYTGVRAEVKLDGPSRFDAGLWELSAAELSASDAPAADGTRTRRALADSPREPPPDRSLAARRRDPTRARAPDAVVEVKNVTLRDGHLALFPDAPTERGRKHLAELTALARAGTRAVLIPFVGRSDVRAFDAAVDIDPAWAHALDSAADAGVLVLPQQARLSKRGAQLSGPLPWERRPR
ncbi:MAG: sugar fermentation stimulation protein [Planctomycetota bacterium]|nr:MAG: sugar fermentation stimulation protein [Planctomycetota bacterium]